MIRDFIRAILPSSYDRELKATRRTCQEIKDLTGYEYQIWTELMPNGQKTVMFRAQTSAPAAPPQQKQKQNQTQGQTQDQKQQNAANGQQPFHHRKGGRPGQRSS